MERVSTKSFVCKTWKTKTAAAVLAIVSAVALPQLFHLLGMASGLGSALGEAFLPMHIAVFLAAFFAGPWVGLAVGFFGPLLSFLLTTAAGQGMPALAMLPYMTVELAVYGLSAGLLKGRIPTFFSLLLAQIAGRGVRAAAVLIGVSAFSSPVSVSVIWSSLLTGLPGLVLQWILVPLLVGYVEEKTRHD